MRQTRATILDTFGDYLGEQSLRLVLHLFLRPVQFPLLTLLIRVGHDYVFESCAKPAPVDGLFFLETLESLFGTFLPSTIFHTAQTASF